MPISLELRAPYGCSIYLRPDSNDYYTFKEIFIDGVYGALVDQVGRPKYVLDLGANIGLATVFFARYWPEMHVVCVEPDDQNMLLLEKNVVPLRNTGCVELCHGAVWGHSGKVGLSDLEQGHVNQFVCHELNEGESGVPAYTIDELMQIYDMPRVDLLKIDVEGAEVSVLTGDISWLEKVRAIAIEFHGNSRRECQFDRLMLDAGFKILDDGGHTVLATRI